MKTHEVAQQEEAHLDWLSGASEASDEAKDESQEDVCYGLETFFENHAFSEITFWLNGKELTLREYGSSHGKAYFEFREKVSA